MKKMKIAVPEVKFLGVVIDCEGIRMDPNKIKAVKAWPEPKIVKEVQDFLGLTNYYRWFVQRYVEKAEPLTQLLKKDTRFIWQEAHKSAFELFKDQFEVGKILIALDPQKPFRVETDTSKWALLGVLYQEKDGQWRPIAFYSRKLVAVELNYDAGDQELLAIIDSVKHWRHHLLGANYPVHIITDHKNLVKFTMTKELIQRYARWSEILFAYDLQITHRKGIENQAADALSHSPEYQKEQSRPELTLLKFKGEELWPTHYIEMIVAKYPEGPNMKKKYEDDKYFQEYQEEFIWRKNWWYHITGGRYLPESMHRNLISNMHEYRLIGHSGRERLAELLDRSYFIPGKMKKIAEVIDNYEKCHTSKPIW
jgi:RNase H-like domain found in reverse transcriptase/Integrase zinc binding domain